jgi:DTW domain-containing protein YfiP
VVPIATRTRVLVLQHPREREKAIGTARIAALCLPHSEIVVGVDFSEHPRVQSLLRDPTRPAVVLYPGDGAKDVIREPPASDVTLVVIDGTWHHAKAITRQNPWLAALPRYAFEPEKPSEYRIRSEPREDYVSTIEALALTLGALEGDPARFQRMLEPFRAMVDVQIDFASRSTGGRKRRRRRRDNLAGSRLARELLSSRLVCMAAEANAWPYDRQTKRSRYPEEIVYVSAARLDGSGDFEAFIAPEQPLAFSPMKHARLDEARVRSGLSRPAFQQAWQTFLRADDILCVWGTYGVNLLRRHHNALPEHVLDVRKVTGDWLKRRPGSVETLLDELALPYQSRGSGRGGERLGMLVAVTRHLAARAASLSHEE